MSVKREREKRENEKRAFQLILEAGEDGILQSDMWKRLESNSQTGSIIARKLERMGIIKRNREFNDGRWTYRLLWKKALLARGPGQFQVRSSNRLKLCPPSS